MLCIHVNAKTIGKNNYHKSGRERGTIPNASFVCESPIFVIQKAAAPKNGVEFCQNPICAVRCSLAMSCDDWQRRATSMRLTGTGRRTDRKTYGVRLTLNKKLPEL